VRLEAEGFQIRPMLDRDNPARSAIFARDQCVAFAGVDSKVATTTSSTCSAVIDDGRPGRGSSASPSRRASTNRARHLPTICTETPSSSATAVFDRPSAHASTILDRSASACAEVRRRAHRCSCSRSSLVSSSTAFGRPVRATHHSTT
jgi:hypothetical protein